MLRIEIPLPTPSLNQVQRMHFQARRRMRDQYEMICRSCATPITRVRPRQFRHVTIVRHGVRQLDHDNLVGGAKILLDALVRTELVYDDAPQYVHVTYEQVPAKAARTKTVVTIA